ncbi:MAG: sigma-70 family RNA polymerase sigma factor [Desulfohalobiaceae bacterium]
MQSTTAREETNLIDRFRQGDPRAMQKLFNKYESSLYNFGLRICSSSQDAEDVLQETFLSAFKAQQGFRGESGLKTWLFRIAAHACFKKRRKKKCQPDFELSLEDLLPASQKEMRYDIPDPGADPSNNILDAELKGIIQDALQQLPPMYRMVFNLRDLEGFSTQEAAQIMELTPQTVKSRLHRARLFLRQAISKRYAKDSDHD